MGEFIDELRPHLETRGVRVGDVVDELDEWRLRYVVRVGGTGHTIYDLTGADADARGDMARGWALAWVRAFEIVNGLLAQSGARERAYTMPEWDVWFLTEEQFDALRAAIPAPRERPYAPIDDPPWYGEEH